MENRVQYSKHPESITNPRSKNIISKEGATTRGQNIYRINTSRLPVKEPFTGDPKCSKSLRAEVIERFKQTCHWCHKKGDSHIGPDGKSWHVDRIKPGVQGGQYTPDNVVLACGPCNKGRGCGKKPRGCQNGSPVNLAGEGCQSYDMPEGAKAMAYNPSGESSVKEEREESPSSLNFKKPLSSPNSRKPETPEQEKILEAWRKSHSIFNSTPYVGSRKDMEAISELINDWPDIDRLDRNYSRCLLTHEPPEGLDMQ